MRREIVAVWVSLLLIVSSIVIIIEFAQVVRAPSIIFVDDVPGSGGPGDPPENFTSIQDAINASSDGDTIYVYNGTYYENVIVYKTLTMIGENKNTTVVDGGWNDDVIHVSSDRVNISGFTITHSGATSIDAGIDLEAVEGCRIVDTIAIENYFGFILHYSNRSTLTGNNATGNWASGIFIRYSNNNTIMNNNASFNDRGISLLYSNDTTISGNIGWNNGDGIRISYSRNITIDFNSVYNSWDRSIYLYYSSGNVVKGNAVSSWWDGIYIYQSDTSNIINNSIFSSNNFGITLRYSNNITLHHNNVINNKGQVSIRNNSDISWDDGMGEGNYWSDYTGVDDGSNGRTAGDGVGDTEIPHPYIDQGDGYYQLDNYPLINPVGNYIFFYNGWNLISIPFIQSETNLETVLSSITGLYSYVQWYNTTDLNDNWKNYCTIKSAGLNDLDNINNTMGFWIFISKQGGVLYKYSGTQLTSNQTIQLHKGWNMVGYPSKISYNRSQGLNNLTFDTHVDAIQWYNAATKTWHFMGPDDSFFPGRGYWVHSKVDVEWEVPL